MCQNLIQIEELEICEDFLVKTKHIKMGRIINLFFVSPEHLT